MTRERIVEEAARLFNRRGYRGTTLDTVARALGVTRAALYYHMSSKEELLFQCYKVPIEIGLEAIRRALAASDAPDEQLRVALAYYIEHMTDDLSGSVVLLEDGTLSPAHRQQITAWRDQYEQQVRAIVARGIQRGVFVGCDPKLIGFAFLGAANWIPKWYDAKGQRSGKEIADVFATYLVRGLQKHPAADAIEPA